MKVPSAIRDQIELKPDAVSYSQHGYSQQPSGPGSGSGGLVAPTTDTPYEQGKADMHHEINKLTKEKQMTKMRATLKAKMDWSPQQTENLTDDQIEAQWKANFGEVLDSDDSDFDMDAFMGGDAEMQEQMEFGGNDMTAGVGREATPGSPTRAGAAGGGGSSPGHPHHAKKQKSSGHPAGGHSHKKQGGGGASPSHSGGGASSPSGGKSTKKSGTKSQLKPGETKPVVKPPDDVHEMAPVFYDNLRLFSNEEQELIRLMINDRVKQLLEWNPANDSKKAHMLSSEEDVVALKAELDLLKEEFRELKEGKELREKDFNRKIEQLEGEVGEKDVKIGDLNEELDKKDEEWKEKTRELQEENDKLRAELDFMKQNAEQMAFEVAESKRIAEEAINAKPQVIEKELSEEEIIEIVTSHNLFLELKAELEKLLERYEKNQSDKKQLQGELSKLLKEYEALRDELN